LKAKKVTKAHFDAALAETRASVTADMEKEYEKIHAQIKTDAFRPTPGIGFIAPGMVTPRGPKD
jgi:transitional endoplasmic reticulum ATPase